jgi:nucleoside-diphosphate-sugar epimerase
MKILITGNLGYLGPTVGPVIKKTIPGSKLFGIDNAYFSGCLLKNGSSPDRYLEGQYFADLRDVDGDLLKGFDSVVHLAAISNDPMGDQFAKQTNEINFLTTIKLAKLAKQAGVRNFVFASSCSVYGAGGSKPKSEKDSLDPLTSYAKSKVDSENGLKEFASNDFKVTCLRFATACGASPRLRLDLVLNDFVASALLANSITILSDGTPWRPLIDTKDMGKAISWAILRNPSATGNYLIVNAGSNDWNFTVADLAKKVAEVIPSAKVEIKGSAGPDKRSYQVCFDLYRELAPEFYPQSSIYKTIEEIVTCLKTSNSVTANFRKEHLIRLNQLRSLISDSQIDSDLRWSEK